MAVTTKQIQLSTRGDTDIIDITSQVSDHLGSSGLKHGIVTVFVPGSTAGITTIEIGRATSTERV